VIAAGLIVGDAILFILEPIPGLDCGWANAVGLPIPGLLGASAGNDELSDPKVLSGVMARLPVCGAARFVAGGDRGGVDQEKAAAGEALLDDLARFTAGLDGRTVDELADDAPPQGSPPSISDLDGPLWFPRTRASKSVSPPPFVSLPFAPVTPPKLMKSLREAATVVELLAPSS
jgi:hypothetical protein